MEYMILSNGIRIPKIGMGGWAQKKNQILDAFAIGYRFVDTAAQYGNEAEIGEAIKQTDVKREDIFLTTKLWTEDVRKHNTIAALEESLFRLQTDYVDLYLIHWPAEGFEDAWNDMEKLYRDGKVRAIGVSNFQIHHLQELKKYSGQNPVMNQIEEHPYFTNQEVVDYCQKNNIAVEAWCPLGGPGSGILKNPVIEDISEKYRKSTSQIILRWQLQRDIITIPKSSNIEHMKANLNIFDFSLTQEEMEMITSLNCDGRLGADPDNFQF